MTGDNLLETAKGLDASLRAEARTIATSMVAFRDLITQAKQQQIHEALGFGSWPAYVADVIGTEMKVLAVDDRRQIVALLAADGMSQRAIADAVGVSQKTVDRDLDQLSHDDSVVLPDKVTSLDGKQRPAHPPKPRPKPQPKPKPQPEPPEHELFFSLVLAQSCLADVYHFHHEHEVTDQVREKVLATIADYRARLDVIERMYRQPPEDDQ